LVVTPEGRPDEEKLTEALKPSSAVTLQKTKSVELPCGATMVDGQNIEKSPFG